MDPCLPTADNRILGIDPVAVINIIMKETSLRGNSDVGSSAKREENTSSRNVSNTKLLYILNTRRAEALLNTVHLFPFVECLPVAMHVTLRQCRGHIIHFENIRKPTEAKHPNPRQVAVVSDPPEHPPLVHHIS